MARRPVKFNTKGFEKALEKAPRVLFVNMKETLKSTGRIFERELLKRRMSGRPGLNRRSGALARSHTSTVKGRSIKSLSMMSGIGGPAAPYAGIQEEGGTVKPTKGRMLAIPLRQAKTAAGVARFKSPRDVPGLFLVHTTSGNTILALDAGRTKKGRVKKRTKTSVGTFRSSGSIIPMYLLVPSVTIPPRLKFFDTWNSLEDSRTRFFDATIDLVVEVMVD